MKRIARNPGKFETLELFAKFSNEHDLKLHSTEDAEKFITLISESLKVSQDNPNLLHGKRIESLFGDIAAGLMNCSLIKVEDAGEVISVDNNIIPPDYKLILKDGRKIFVEVKNCNLPNPKSTLYFRRDYIEKLLRYGELNGIPIYFAIYYRCLKIWTLLPISSLDELKHKYSTNALYSYAKSEMSLLGDKMIGTKPPLIFELVADKSKEKQIDQNGYANFTISGVNIYCGNKIIEEPEEKKIAFYLIRYGSWKCELPEPIMDENNILYSVRYIFNPEFLDGVEQNGFSTIGNLSSMITEAFNEYTLYEQQVISIKANIDPSVFSVRIPIDYEGKNLPLWLFSLQPNPNFNS